MSRIRVVRALKITEELFTDPHPNPRHIPGWVYNPGLRLVELPNRKIAKVGNWVVEETVGDFKVFFHDDFEKLYMPLVMTQRLPLSLVIPKKELPHEANLPIIELCNLAHNSGFWVIGGFLPFKTLENGRLLESDPERPYASFSNIGPDPGNMEKIPTLLKELAQQIAMDLVASKITESGMATLETEPHKTN